MELEQHDDVVVIDMGTGENRFNPSTVAELDRLLDDVEARAAIGEPLAMVTAGSGKFFSNGIDLDWMMSGDSDDPMSMVTAMMQMWARVMSLPIPTVAAVNGHAFAGGAMFSLAHDHIVMRSDRGYWCVNEALLRMRLAPGMQAILSARLPAPTARKAILTAHRFDGAAAVLAGIADETCEEAAVRPRAIELARSLAHTAHPTLGALKEDLHQHALAVLREGAGPEPITG